MGTRLVMRTAWLVLGLGLMAATVGRTGEAKADEPAFIALGAGAFDMFDDEVAGEFRVEYRSDLRLWHFAPFIGGMVTTDGAVYGYGGFGVDILLGNSFVFTPNAALGLYHEGDGKDLGGPIEFRTGAELAYRFEDQARLGIAFHHISNAGLYDNNSGEESLVLIYAMPLGG